MKLLKTLLLSFVLLFVSCSKNEIAIKEIDQEQPENKIKTPCKFDISILLNTHLRAFHYLENP